MPNAKCRIPPDSTLTKCQMLNAKCRSSVAPARSARERRAGAKERSHEAKWERCTVHVDLAFGIWHLAFQGEAPISRSPLMSLSMPSATVAASRAPYDTRR
jgi:hypothetical protein